MAVDPFTMMSMATSAMDTIGNITSLTSQASTSELNARLAESDAKRAIAQGNLSVRDQEKSGDQIIADQLLAYSKAGVKFSGSVSQAYLETAKAIRQNIIMTRLQAAENANQYMFEAGQQRVQAAKLKGDALMSGIRGIISMGSKYGSAKFNEQTAKKINNYGKSKSVQAKRLRSKGKLTYKPYNKSLLEF